MHPQSPADDIFDLIGLGFGPANVAIAGALVDEWSSTKETCPIKHVLFLEKSPKFQWHPGMLIPDARMQISFMKDLATLRSPTSPITFLSYLHAEGRLVSFINRGSTIPTRKEFADYLAYAARYVQNNGVSVSFGTEVVSLDEGKDGIISVQGRNVATGQVSTYRTRDLILAPGGQPRIPQCLARFANNPLVIHSASYLASIGSLLQKVSRRTDGLRIAVIGSGQSAAEVTLELRERLSSFPTTSQRHAIEMIICKGSLKPSDDSPFSNEVFDPRTTDAWFKMSDAGRLAHLKEYKSTNYGVVNPRTIDAFYEVIYDQQVDEAILRREQTNGQQPRSITSPKIILRPNSYVVSVESQHQDPTEEQFSVILQDLIQHDMHSETYDAIICATGYQRTQWVDLLRSSIVGKRFGLHPSITSSACRLVPASQYEASDRNQVESGASTPSGSGVSTPITSPPDSLAGSFDHLPLVKVAITRNYQLMPQDKEGFQSRIYLQGVEEATHGLSDSLLSVLGIRAGEVVDDLIRGRAASRV